MVKVYKITVGARTATRTDPNRAVMNALNHLGYTFNSDDNEMFNELVKTLKTRGIVSISFDDEAIINGYKFGSNIAIINEVTYLFKYYLYDEDGNVVESSNNKKTLIKSANSTTSPRTVAISYNGDIVYENKTQREINNW